MSKLLLLMMLAGCSDFVSVCCDVEKVLRCEDPGTFSRDCAIRCGGQMRSVNYVWANEGEKYCRTVEVWRWPWQEKASPTKDKPTTGGGDE